MKYHEEKVGRLIWCQKGEVIYFSKPQHQSQCAFPGREISGPRSYTGHILFLIEAALDLFPPTLGKACRTH
jgi:hypothetical protein